MTGASDVCDCVQGSENLASGGPGHWGHGLWGWVLEGKICSFICLSPSSGWSADRGEGSSPGCPALPESGYLRSEARVSSFRSLTAQVPRCKKPSLPKGTETLPCPRGAEQGTKPQHQGDTMPSISQSSHSETPLGPGLALSSGLGMREQIIVASWGASGES